MLEAYEMDKWKKNVLIDAIRGRRWKMVGPETRRRIA
jgi:hypothetical protein